MKIPDFYDKSWKSLECRKDYEKPRAKLAYLRKEYELWALWISKFYSGEHGIYTTLTGDAPRYALEYEMDFCYWDTTYDLNYPKRNHLANHKVRAEYIVKRLTELFNDVDNYVLRTKSEMESEMDSDDIDEDEGFNLDFQEMKEQMMNDPTYKQKWFKAAYAANDYIENILNKSQPKTMRSRRRMKTKTMRSRRRSKTKTMRSRRRMKTKTMRSRRRSKSKAMRSKRRTKSKAMRSRRMTKSKSVRKSKSKKRRSRY